MANPFEKSAYVCGPLTELPTDLQPIAKEFYSKVAAVCERRLKKRGFVPHEHYDPVLHANFTPQQVYLAERAQVCDRTSLLIIVTGFGPSWGGGTEAAWATEADVPAIILCPAGRKISRLLLGNPAVEVVFYYDNQQDALNKLDDYLCHWQA